MNTFAIRSVLPVPGVGEVRFLPGRDIHFLPDKVLPWAESEIRTP